MIGDELDQYAGTSANRVRDIGVVNVRIGELNASTTQVKVARAVCYLLGVVTVGTGAYTLYTGGSGPDELGAGIGIIVEGLLYIGCGILVPRKPLLFVGLAAGLYVLGLVIQGVTMGPGVVAQGYLWKALILFALGRALYTAAQRGRMIRELRAAGVSREHLSPAKRLATVPAIERVQPSVG